MKSRWADRIQPYIGLVLLSLSMLVLSAAYERGDLEDANSLRQVGPAAFMALAGLGMVVKARGRQRWLFLLSAVGVSLFMRTLL